MSRRWRYSCLILMLPQEQPLELTAWAVCACRSASFSGRARAFQWLTCELNKPAIVQLITWSWNFIRNPMVNKAFHESMDGSAERTLQIGKENSHSGIRQVMMPWYWPHFFSSGNSLCCKGSAAMGFLAYLIEFPNHICYHRETLVLIERWNGSLKT